jgi:hypothetical protein
VLPQPYERWFVELTGRGTAVESRATCDHCAMLPDAPDLPPEGPFDPATLCCTYHPQLAPHFVGGILKDGSEAGRAHVRARIAARVGVSPLGLLPPPEYASLYARASLRAGAFGRTRELLCPFHDAGRCTIWQHRGAACASFHCKFDRGALGHGLWNLLVIGFNAVERALARWLLAEAGLDAAACDAFLHAPADDALDARAWGAWRGREEAWFVEAARRVEALSFAEVLALGGRDLAPLGDALRGAVSRFDDLTPPARVRAGDGILHHIGLPGRARLQHPGVPLDLLELSAEVAARVRQIAAPIPTAEVALDDGLLRQLLDWQVLIPSV